LYFTEFQHIINEIGNDKNGRIRVCGQIGNYIFLVVAVLAIIARVGLYGVYGVLSAVRPIYGRTGSKEAR
jgi:hypothetical protein